MCGIVGVVSKERFSSQELIRILKRLEYRGYDSFGYATNDGKCEKFVGNIDETRVAEANSCAAISHTRWATHGGVTEQNSHPHSDCEENIHIVHNGIIENYGILRIELESKGHFFKSQTDSEVVSHYFEEKLKSMTIEKAVESFFRDIKGEFAILLLRKNDNRIYAFKRGSPLVLGLMDGINVLSSDVYAFINKTNKAIFFNEDDFAVITDSGYIFYNISPFLKPVEKEIQTIEYIQKEESKDRYEHYMIKEIHEQPDAARILINSLRFEQAGNLEMLKELMSKSKRIVFVASGSSYHASLFGAYFLTKAGIEAHTVIASEFRTFTLLDKNTLVIAVSQSGETMDVIEALHGIKALGVKIASLVNTPYSTVQRMSNISINIMAGQEVCVAATKTFTNQVILLAYIAHMFGYDFNIDNIPEKMKSVFEQEDQIKQLAKKLKDRKDIYIIGRGYTYPVARETALKLKEISYIHAEGMMAGELKHGTLALIEQGVPVISLIPKDDNAILSNTKEIETREGHIIAITNNPDVDYPDKFIIKTDYELHFCILSNMIGQLLTYYIAKEKELPIDRPRNLAKSVTVK